MAREKGLEPLALLLLDQGRDCPAPEEAARDYVEYVEQAIGCHIGYVSVGAERESLIIR